MVKIKNFMDKVDEDALFSGIVIDNEGKIIESTTVFGSDFKDETDSIIMKCNKAMRDYYISQTKKGKTVDYITVSGTIKYFVDFATAEEIIEYREKTLERVRNALRAMKYSRASTTEEWNKLESKLGRAISYSDTQFCTYLGNLIAEEVFAPYAYVSLRDLSDYYGSDYATCKNNDFKTELIAEGFINLENFVRKIKESDFIEGNTPKDFSITWPTCVLEQCIKGHIGDTYFGFAKKYSKNPRKTSK